MRLTFDHGTLVLLEAPEDHVRDLPGVRWDPRVALFRAPAHRYTDIVLALRQRGLAFRDEVRSEPIAPRAWSPPPLRPYQRAAQVAWEVGDQRGLVVLPTGGGKTRVAIAILAELGLPALVVVPTRALLRQWHAELAAWCPQYIGILGDGQRDLGRITVATFESAYRHMAELGDRFDVLVVDEVHHFGSAQRDELLEMSVAPVRLGLTATPPEASVLERLAELVGPVVFRLGLGDLAGKYLADFDLVVLKLPLDHDERARYDTDHRAFAALYRRLMEQHPGLGWDEFQLLAGQTPEGRGALAAWRRSRRVLAFPRKKAKALSRILARHRGARVLVFTADNESAYQIAREHLIMPITCEIGRGERERALAAFREGRLGALVSSRVLNEGIDVPDADVAVIVGGTQSEREHVQRIGRLLRPAAGKRAVVYELVASATREVQQSRSRRRGLVQPSPLSS